MGHKSTEPRHLLGRWAPARMGATGPTWKLDHGLTFIVWLALAQPLVQAAGEAAAATLASTPVWTTYGTMAERVAGCFRELVEVRKVRGCKNNDNGTHTWYNRQPEYRNILVYCLAMELKANGSNYHSADQMVQARMALPQNVVDHNRAWAAQALDPYGLNYSFTSIPQAPQWGNYSTYYEDAVHPPPGGSAAGWGYTARLTGDLVERQPNLLLDMSTIVAQDASIEWNGVLPFIRRTMLLYNQRTYALPMDGGNVALLWYRKDVLAYHNLTVPKTWDELIEVASIVNGTDADGDGQPEFGVCLDSTPHTGCLLRYWASAMLASQTQTMGSSQGALLDPATMQWLINSTAFENTLAMLRQLVPYAMPPSSSNCDFTSIEFANQGCALMVTVPDQFKLNARSPVGQGSRVGIANIPGSPLVLDRANNTLVPCTPETCPFGAVRTRPDGTAELYNVVVSAIASRAVCGVNRLAPLDQQLLGYHYCFSMANAVDSWQAVLEPQVPTAPYRTEHLQDMSRWVAAGYDLHDTEQYLSALRLVSDHPNVALDLTIQGGPEARSLLHQLSQPVITTDVAISTVMGWASGNLSYIYSTMDIESARRVYWQAIGYSPPPPASPPPPMSSPPDCQGGLCITPGSGSGSDPGSGSKSILELGLIVGLPLGVTFLLVLLGTVIAMRKRKKYTDPWVIVDPPGPGPLTTILVSDIQDSTLLWESLPTLVMDEGLTVHNCVIRELLPKHQGYESHTEGDSFTLAFKDPAHALAFALEAQRALLYAPWPEELLELGHQCQPVFVPLPPSARAPLQRLGLALARGNNLVGQNMASLMRSSAANTNADSADSPASGPIGPIGGKPLQSGPVLSLSPGGSFRSPRYAQTHHHLQPPHRHTDGNILSSAAAAKHSRGSPASVRCQSHRDGRNCGPEPGAEAADDGMPLPGSTTPSRSVGGWSWRSRHSTRFRQLSLSMSGAWSRMRQAWSFKGRGPGSSWSMHRTGSATAAAASLQLRALQHVHDENRSVHPRCRAGLREHVSRVVRAAQSLSGPEAASGAASATGAGEEMQAWGGAEDCNLYNGCSFAGYSVGRNSLAQHQDGSAHSRGTVTNAGDGGPWPESNVHDISAAAGVGIVSAGLAEAAAAAAATMSGGKDSCCASVVLHPRSDHRAWVDRGTPAWPPVAPPAVAPVLSRLASRMTRVPDSEAVAGTSAFGQSSSLGRSSRMGVSPSCPSLAEGQPLHHAPSVTIAIDGSPQGPLGPSGTSLVAQVSRMGRRSSTISTVDPSVGSYSFPNPSPGHAPHQHQSLHVSPMASPLGLGFPGSNSPAAFSRPSSLSRVGGFSGSNNCSKDGVYGVDMYPRPGSGAVATAATAYVPCGQLGDLPSGEGMAYDGRPSGTRPSPIWSETLAAVASLRTSSCTHFSPYSTRRSPTGGEARVGSDLPSTNFNLAAAAFAGSQATTAAASMLLQPRSASGSGGWPITSLDLRALLISLFMQSPDDGPSPRGLRGLGTRKASLSIGFGTRRQVTNYFSIAGDLQSAQLQLQTVQATSINGDTTQRKRSGRSGLRLLVPRQGSVTTPAAAAAAVVGSPTAGPLGPVPGGTNCNNVLLFRGFRVRVGMHSGISTPTDIVYSPENHRVVCSGDSLSIAKAVAGAGAGGMVLLSGSSHAALLSMGDAASSAMAGQQASLIYMGEHLLAEDLAPTDLFQACCSVLLPRVVMTGDVRSQAVLQLGALAAPATVPVVLASIQVAGLEALEAWNREVAGGALELFWQVVKAQLRTKGGLVVDAGRGCALLAFPHVHVAMLWGLDCKRELQAQAWPQQLLEHELGEMIVMDYAEAAEAATAALAAAEARGHSWTAMTGGGAGASPPGAGGQHAGEGSRRGGQSWMWNAGASGSRWPSGAVRPPSWRADAHYSIDTLGLALPLRECSEGANNPGAAGSMSPAGTTEAQLACAGGEVGGGTGLLGRPGSSTLSGSQWDGSVGPGTTASLLLHPGRPSEGGEVRDGWSMGSGSRRFDTTRHHVLSPLATGSASFTAGAFGGASTAASLATRTDSSSVMLRSKAGGSPHHSGRPSRAAGPREASLPTGPCSLASQTLSSGSCARQRLLRPVRSHEPPAKPASGGVDRPTHHLGNVARGRGACPAKVPGATASTAATPFASAPLAFSKGGGGAGDAANAAANAEPPMRRSSPDGCFVLGNASGAPAKLPGPSSMAPSGSRAVSPRPSYYGGSAVSTTTVTAPTPSSNTSTSQTPSRASSPSPSRRLPAQQHSQSLTQPHTQQQSLPLHVLHSWQVQSRHGSITLGCLNQGKSQGQGQGQERGHSPGASSLMHWQPASPSCDSSARLLTPPPTALCASGTSSGLQTESANPPETKDLRSSSSSSRLCLSTGLAVAELQHSRAEASSHQASQARHLEPAGHLGVAADASRPPSYPRSFDYASTAGASTPAEMASFASFVLHPTTTPAPGMAPVLEDVDAAALTGGTTALAQALLNKRLPGWAGRISGSTEPPSAAAAAAESRTAIAVAMSAPHPLPSSVVVTMQAGAEVPVRPFTSATSMGARGVGAGWQAGPESDVHPSEPVLKANAAIRGEQGYSFLPFHRPYTTGQTPAAYPSRQGSSRAGNHHDVWTQPLPGGSPTTKLGHAGMGHGSAAPHPHMCLPPLAHQLVHHRGLRIKVAVHVSSRAAPHVNARTGRMTYGSPAGNKVRQLAAKAKCDQILCSHTANLTLHQEQQALQSKAAALAAAAAAAALDPAGSSRAGGTGPTNSFTTPTPTFPESMPSPSNGLEIQGSLSMTLAGSMDPGAAAKQMGWDPAMAARLPHLVTQPVRSSTHHHHGPVSARDQLYSCTEIGPAGQLQGWYVDGPGGFNAGGAVPWPSFHPGVVSEAGMRSGHPAGLPSGSVGQGGGLTSGPTSAGEGCATGPFSLSGPFSKTSQSQQYSGPLSPQQQYVTTAGQAVQQPGGTGGTAAPPARPPSNSHLEALQGVRLSLELPVSRPTTANLGAGAASALAGGAAGEELVSRGYGSSTGGGLPLLSPAFPFRSSNGSTIPSLVVSPHVAATATAVGATAPAEPTHDPRSPHAVLCAESDYQHHSSEAAVVSIVVPEQALLTGEGQLAVLPGSGSVSDREEGGLGDCSAVGSVTVGAVAEVRSACRRAAAAADASDREAADEEAADGGDEGDASVAYLPMPAAFATAPPGAGAVVAAAAAMGRRGSRYCSETGGGGDAGGRKRRSSTASRRGSGYENVSLTLWADGA